MTETLENKLLLTGVFKPYGVKNKYAEGVGMSMELEDNQLSRGQGVHSFRRNMFTNGLYLLAENISVPTVILDFPSWRKFKKELENGYTHIGIAFITQNIHKAARMTEYVRKNHPDTKIIIGGYGVLIPEDELRELVLYDECCKGEGISWLRNYFGEIVNAPFNHPINYNSVNNRVYGVKLKSIKNSVLFPGLGCTNACSFCLTSAKYDYKYIPFLSTGTEAFKVCLESDNRLDVKSFVVVDENFLKKPDRAKDLLKEMENNKKHYRFSIFSSAEAVTSLGIDFLVRLGISTVWIGAEGKFSSFPKNKGINTRDLIEELQSNGISVIASVILFLDAHDENTIKEDIDWAIDLNSNFLQFMMYTPLHPTLLYKKLDEKGRIRHDLDYKYQTGFDEIAFDHPNFKDPKRTGKYVTDAFKKKYHAFGPSFLGVVETQIKGYVKTKEDFAYRQDNNLFWNPDTLKYEHSENGQFDDYMNTRIGSSTDSFRSIYPFFLPAKIFSPNKKSREKAKSIKKLYIDVFGKPSFGVRLKSYIVVLFALKEHVKILFNKMRGYESVPYQPPTKRTEYNF